MFYISTELRVVEKIFKELLKEDNGGLRARLDHTDPQRFFLSRCHPILEPLSKNLYSTRK